ncbi:unnamed protein product, partial [Linum tenue]
KGGVPEASNQRDDTYDCTRQSRCCLQGNLCKTRRDHNGLRCIGWNHDPNQCVGDRKGPAYWGESPEEFLPEQFLQTKVDFIGQDFELIPFGAGRRRCPGISFGLAVVEVALANLVRDFDWRLPGGMRLEMTECVGLTARRDVPLLAIPTIVSAGQLD